MKIWYESILVAMVILTGYLVMLADQYLPRLSANAEEAQASFKLVQDRLDKQTELLAKLQADISKLGKESAPPKLPQEDKDKIAVDSLRTSVKNLSDADAKKQQGDVNAAIDILKTVKKTLWQAGDTLPTYQADLRALMGPLDVIIGKWKQGDKAVDTSKISLAIKTILQKIDSKFDT
ncbi:hypothetical protein [Methyloglobulus sp.]|uniref:hypothetical protein n=1 Tax=Methyloglobulus sp. TaxID=2518622 RepID=UPI0032B836B1